MDLFNSLPDHILIQIFEYLSPNMMKCCALVCKRFVLKSLKIFLTNILITLHINLRWDTIVGYSKLMERFQLNLKKSEKKIQEAKDLKRKHRSALINQFESSLNIIYRHNLHSLKIQHLQKITLSSLINVLNKFPSLKVLDINLPRLIDDIAINNFKKLKLNLKELECPTEIAYIFDCKFIKELKMTWFVPVDDDKKKFAIDFFKQQNNIEEMTLYGDYFGEFFTNSEILDLKFTLKVLRLACYNEKKKFLHAPMLIKFLERHKESLLILELHFATESAYNIKFIHNYVLENLINLIHLEFAYICVDDSDDEDEFIDENDDDDDIILRELQFLFDEFPYQSRAAKNIESLTVVLAEDQSNYNLFFAAFPNLKHLAFWSKSEDVMLYSSSLNSVSAQLESLQLMDHSGDTDELDEHSYFPHLKEIFIGRYWETNLWKFINRHSNTLEKIRFQDCRDLSYLTAKAILNCTQLKYLNVSFDTPNVCMIAMLNEISFRPGPFTLKISFPFQKYLFIFPDDRVLWNEEIENLNEKLYENCCGVQ